MITLREPEVVRGDVPGLLCRGMPLMADACDGVPRDQPVRGVVAALTPLDVAFEDYLPIEGTPGLVTAGRIVWRRRRVALAEKSDRLRGAGHGSRRR